MSNEEKSEDKPSVPSNSELAGLMNEEAARYDDIGDSETANNLVSLANKIDPSNSLVASNVILLLMRSDSYEEALAFAEDFCTKYSVVGNKFLCQYLDVLLRLERYEEARKIYEDENFHQDCSAYPWYQRNYAHCLLNTGNPREAEKWVRASLAQEEVSFGYQVLICCFEKNNNFFENEQEIIRALRLNRNDDGSIAFRRYWAAQFYHSWFQSLQGLDLTNAKAKLYQAYDYAQQAVAEARLESLDDENNTVRLEDSNQLFADIEAEIKRIENGFEPPELTN